MLDSNTLLKGYTQETPGIFILQKTKFLNAHGINVVHDTEYANESFVIDTKSGLNGTKVESRQVVKYEKVIDASPDFIIIYVEFRSSNKSVKHIDIQKPSTPSVMWYGRSFFHLLKNMREWQYIHINNIDKNHPMGIYSNIAIEKLNPSQQLIEEIDGWPDMHLAKFFKGDEDYRLIPENFPEPSEKMKQWVLLLAEKYKEKTFSKIQEII
jgi:hypothetical protein